MKLRLLLFAVFISFASCSGDDSSPVDENPNPVNKVLYQTENFNYRYPSQPYKQVTTFENDKPVSAVSYDEEGNILFTATYIYYESGNLKKLEVFRADGSVENIQSLEYDAQGRLTKHTRDALSTMDLFEITDYVYNSDNTITATESLSWGGEPQIKTCTFFYNTDGVIVKIKEPTFDSYEYYEAECSSNGIIQSVTNYTDTQVQSVRDFTYSDAVLKGGYAKRQDIYGGFNNNVLIIKSFLASTQSYLISIQYSFIAENMTIPYNDFDNSFLFDTDGYPISEKNYINNVLNYETNIIYQEAE